MHCHWWKTDRYDSLPVFLWMDWILVHRIACLRGTLPIKTAQAAGVVHREPWAHSSMERRCLLPKLLPLFVHSLVQAYETFAVRPVSVDGPLTCLREC